MWTLSKNFSNSIWVLNEYVWNLYEIDNFSQNHRHYELQLMAHSISAEDEFVVSLGFNACNLRLPHELKNPWKADWMIVSFENIWLFLIITTFYLLRIDIDSDWSI